MFRASPVLRARLALERFFTLQEQIWRVWYDHRMPKVTIILETDRTLEGVTLTDQELARLRGDLASGSGTLEFQDGHGHQVVLTVQHIMEVVINGEEEARPPGD